MDSEAARTWIKVAADSFYDSVEPVFEDLRSSNEDLRGSAETQIEELENGEV